MKNIKKIDTKKANTKDVNAKVRDELKAQGQKAVLGCPEINIRGDK